MQVFAVFNVSKPDLVKQKIKEHYSDNFYQADDSFFIATHEETTRAVAEKIGFGDDPVGTGIVISVTYYWGCASGEMWEWISVKKGANG